MSHNKQLNRNNPPLFIVCLLNSKLYSVYCILYIELLYSLHCTLTIYRTMLPIYRTLSHCTVYTLIIVYIHYTMHFVRYTVYSVHCTLCTACTLCSELFVAENYLDIVHGGYPSAKVNLVHVTKELFLGLAE